jgi:hypothetical protein
MILYFIPFFFFFFFVDKLILSKYLKDIYIYIYIKIE